MAELVELADDLVRFLSLSRVYQQSKAFNAAVNLRLFTVLERDGPELTGAQLSAALGLCAVPGFRGATDLFDLLVSLRVLQRTGSGADARYHNSPAASIYLVEGRPQYVGGIMLVNNNRSYHQFAFLESVLKQGCLPEEAWAQLAPLFSEDDPAAESFALGMTGASLGNSRVFARTFDFTRYRSMGDMGGSVGVLSVCVCLAHTHMRATTYDLPAVHSAAEKHVAGNGMQEQVQVADWDFFSDKPFPQHDVLTMGMILHDWGHDKKLVLMRKAYEALPTGGAFVAIDAVIDDERRHNSEGLAMSLNMLLEFGKQNAYDYTFQEFVGWSTQVGFASTEKIPLLGAFSAAVAYK